MINASEARANVTRHETELYNNIKAIVDEILETMSRSIEFHSQNGIEYADFMPYRDSRFSSEYSCRIASEIFEKEFIDNGYTVVRNDWVNNCLKVTW